ncbi:MAG: FAD-dependent oxidoreductase, partial [Rhodothermales bacterium]|nr:FAD-dependent oxidoreductase [Rhodothermales bacterium]
AEGFETQGDRVTAVRTADGPMHAEEIVLAAGAWTGRLASALGLRVPVQPAKGYSVTVPAPDGGPRLPTILTDEKLTITPMPGRLRFAGTLALAGFDATVDARRAAPIRALAGRYAPAAAEHAPVWSGFRPCSPDGLPIIGRSPRHRNLTLATGHGMMGITLAPVTGDLVAHLVAGTMPALDVRPLAPDRF